MDSGWKSAVREVYQVSSGSYLDITWCICELQLLKTDSSADEQFTTPPATLT